MPKTSEIKLVRLHPRASSLFVPTMALAASLFSLMYFSELLSPELYQIVFWSAIVFAGLFWLIPLLNWLASSLVITDQRVINRSGFIGLRRRVLQLSELSSIAVQRPKPLRGKVISLIKVDGQEITVGGYSRTKLLAATIEAEASKTL